MNFGTNIRKSKDSNELKVKQPERMYASIENKLRLRISTFLGRGKFSDVHMAIDQRTGLVFALKIIKKMTVIEH